MCLYSSTLGSINPMTSGNCSRRIAQYMHYKNARLAQQRPATRVSDFRWNWSSERDHLSHDSFRNSAEYIFNIYFNNMVPLLHPDWHVYLRIDKYFYSSPIWKILYHFFITPLKYPFFKLKLRILCFKNISSNFH